MIRNYILRCSSFPFKIHIFIPGFLFKYSRGIEIITNINIHFCH